MAPMIREVGAVIGAPSEVRASRHSIGASLGRGRIVDASVAPMRWILALPVLVGCGNVPPPEPGDTPDAPGACEPPYTSTPLGCHRFVPTPAPWLAAEQDCEDDAAGAHLVIIDSVDEHFAIHELTTSTTDVWLAYTDRVTEGSLLWLTSGGLDPTSNPCFFGPSAVNSAALDCVTQDGTSSCGDWFYRGCDELHAYVCERDGSPPDEARY
jgi:hypothetical protein